jgi:TRAP-type mannitol/chloroaromatic compound transport system permease small subunit
VIDSVNKYIAYFTAIILALLVMLIVYDASARYLFSSGSTALQELEWHFFDIIILLSISYALKHNAHVRVDIFYEKFSLKTQALINIIATLFFILPLSLLIVYIGIGFVEISFVQNEMSSDPGGLTHRWIVKSLMPLSFAFVALQAISELIRHFKEWKVL